MGSAWYCAGMRSISRRKAPWMRTRDAVRPGDAGPGRERLRRRRTRSVLGRGHYVYSYLTGFLFRIVMLDAFSRRVVGWSMANHLRTRPVLDTLDTVLCGSIPVGGRIVVRQANWCECSGCFAPGGGFGIRTISNQPSRRKAEAPQGPRQHRTKARHLCGQRKAGLPHIRLDRSRPARIIVLPCRLSPPSDSNCPRPGSLPMAGGSRIPAQESHTGRRAPISISRPFLLPYGRPERSRAAQRAISGRLSPRTPPSTPAQA